MTDGRATAYSERSLKTVQLFSLKARGTLFLTAGQRTEKLPMTVRLTSALVVAGCMRPIGLDLENLIWFDNDTKSTGILNLSAREIIGSSLISRTNN